MLAKKLHTPVLVTMVLTIIEMPVVLATYNRDEVMKKYPGFGKDFIMFPNGKNGIKMGFLDTPAETSRIFNIGSTIEEDVTFTLYTRDNINGTQLTNYSDLVKNFDRSKKTAFITHGWMASGKEGSPIALKDAYLNTSDVNVFIVDWSPIAGNIFYFIPKDRTKDVGAYFSRLLNFLVTDLGMNPKKFHLIGHSLGAHVSGFAARGLTRGKVGRITGLDPALPGFLLDENGRLNKNDSSFVDVIHTCAGFLGLKQSIGHADFYPNGGGPPQPGCTILEILEACSHGRSWDLFENSIVLRRPFEASKCASSNDLNKKDCNGPKVPMGEPTPRSSRVMSREKEYYRTLPPVNFKLVDAIATDVTFHLFKSEDEEEKILTEATVADEEFERSLPTIVLFHGWTTNRTSPWFELLRNEYFRLGLCNIIYVDWSPAGSKSYEVSCANAKRIGKFVANFLQASTIPLENIHLIGHSLGCHVTGFVGKKIFKRTGNKIARITALDPAGPCFEHELMAPNHRLCEEDATFVDVIHTDIQFYGFTEPIGHVDYYPNGGQHQKGCPPRENGTEEEVNCSHARSTLYFIESLSTMALAKQATFEMDGLEVSIKVKTHPREIVFGQHVNKSERGVYYFETNEKAPFLQPSDK